MPDTGKAALGGIDGNLAALLGYIIWIIALISVIMEKENRFVKFHSVQVLFLAALQIAIGLVLGFLGLILNLALNTFDMGWMSWFMILGLRFILAIVFLILWIMGGIKAYGGQWYKLPIIGEFAWKAVNK